MDFADKVSIKDTTDCTAHPHYELFLVHDHPFISQQTTKQMIQIPMIRSLIWQSHNDSILVLNQRIIPQKFGTIQCETYQQMSKAIEIMTVRGAPLIGVSAGYGMALAALQFYKQNTRTNTKVSPAQFVDFMQKAKATLDASRPTAVNLVWATNRMQQIMIECIDILNKNKLDRKWLKNITEILLSEAHQICSEDIDVSVKLGEYGSSIIERGFGVMHHCNTGTLAAVCGGTALSAITKAYYDNKDINVYVNETRPRLQGSRLTSWELSRMNIDHKVVVDGCCAHLMSSNKINCVIVGCDRVAINGDTANKIGTHTVATVAHQYGIPFYISCPVSTIDDKCLNGTQIVIEERNKSEIQKIDGINVANPNADFYNPAFDVTPHKFITGFITEYGICYPPFRKTLKNVVKKSQTAINTKRENVLRKYRTKMATSRSRL